MMFQKVIINLTFFFLLMASLTRLQGMEVSEEVEGSLDGLSQTVILEDYSESFDPSFEEQEKEKLGLGASKMSERRKDEFSFEESEQNYVLSLSPRRDFQGFYEWPLESSTFMRLERKEFLETSFKRSFRDFLKKEGKEPKLVFDRSRPPIKISSSKKLEAFLKKKRTKIKNIFIDFNLSDAQIEDLSKEENLQCLIKAPRVQEETEKAQETKFEKARSLLRYKNIWLQFRELEGWSLNDVKELWAHLKDLPAEEKKEAQFKIKLFFFKIKFFFSRGWELFLRDLKKFLNSYPFIRDVFVEDIVRVQFKNFSPGRFLPDVCSPEEIPSLKHPKRPFSLDLSYNFIGPQDLKIIARHLQSFENLSLHLRDLDLCSAMASIRRGDHIFESLKNLTFLDLHHNGVSGGTLVKLFEVSEVREGLGGKNFRPIKMPFLTTLKVTRNNIGDKSLKVLMDAIKYMPSLTFLDLSRNSLKDEGMRTIVSGLAENGTLKKLFLPNTRMTQEGVKALMPLLEKEGSSLKKLDVSYNHLGSQGIKILLDSLEENTVLRKLKFRNTAGRDEERDFSNYLKDRKKRLQSPLLGIKNKEDF